MITKQDYETLESCILSLKIIRENLLDNKEVSKQTLDVAICYLQKCLLYLKQSEEQDKQIIADAIDEFAEEIKNLVYKWFERGVINIADIDKIAEQRKEQK